MNRNLFLAAAVAGILATPVAALAEPDTLTEIRRFCAGEWPRNYRMQRYCIDRQTDGIRRITSVVDGYGKGGEEYQIVVRCMGKWSAPPNGYDYRMVAYCTDNQLEAYQAIRGLAVRGGRQPPAASYARDPAKGGALPAPDKAASANQRSATPWDLSDDRELMRKIQEGLKLAGYDPGPLDGTLGPQTKAAIEAYQRDRGLAVDGAPTSALFGRLRAD